MLLLILEVSSVSLYYCNSSITTAPTLGMVDGMFFFVSTVVTTWINARDTCATWPLPNGARNVQFISSDVMNVNPDSIRPSLGVLRNTNNFNLWLSFINTVPKWDTWVGLSQNINASSSTAVPLQNVYEPSFNWTWIDGTSLFQDTQGQGLPYFMLVDPDNNANANCARSDQYLYLVDSPCDWLYRGLCSIPRKLIISKRSLNFLCQQICAQIQVDHVL
jgi:hypothetical protein